MRVREIQFSSGIYERAEDKRLIAALNAAVNAPETRADMARVVSKLFEKSLSEATGRYGMRVVQLHEFIEPFEAVDPNNLVKEIFSLLKKEKDYAAAGDALLSEEDVAVLERVSKALLAVTIASEDPDKSDPDAVDVDGLRMHIITAAARAGLPLMAKPAPDAAEQALAEALEQLFAEQKTHALLEGVASKLYPANEIAGSAAHPSYVLGFLAVNDMNALRRAYTITEAVFGGLGDLKHPPQPAEGKEIFGKSPLSEADVAPLTTVAKEICALAEKSPDNHLKRLILERSKSVEIQK